MQVKLEKRYAIGSSTDTAWQILRDIKELASCMPGAEITEKIDDAHYKGRVKVKVGPASTAFGGTIEIVSYDELQKTIHIVGKGSERGGSTASMDLTASIHPGESNKECILLGNSDVIVNGKFAQFGGRMMTSVSDMILGKFADNFSAKASHLSAQNAPAEVHDEQSAPQPAPQSTSAAPVHKELNALAIFWGLIKNFFTSLFAVRK
jgi:carbon monoxide dehydrogenase subunit G